MEHTSHSLMNAVLSKKPFRHPNQNVIEGDYEFVRFNQDSKTVSLNNCKTGERVEIDREVVFSAMKTSITEDYLEMLFHGANYKKPEQSQPKCTELEEKIFLPGHPAP